LNKDSHFIEVDDEVSVEVNEIKQALEFANLLIKKVEAAPV